MFSCAAIQKNPSSRTRLLGTLTGLLIFGGLLHAAPAQAATIIVSTTDDEFGTGAACSLREAIEAHRISTAFGGCPAGTSNDVIEIPAGTYTITRANVGGQEFLNQTGSLDLTNTLVLDGQGDADDVVIDGNGLDRVFTTGSSTATFRDLTITGGDAGVSPDGGSGGNGGGISSSIGTNVTLERVVVRDNYAFSGGGISAPGTWTLRQTSIIGNRTAYAGAGIVVFGSLSMENTTISDNEASTHPANTQPGGGIYMFSGTSMNLLNSTVASNAADVGPAGVVAHGSATFKNTIVAGNSPTNCAAQGAGSLNSNGNNMEDTNTCSFGAGGDQPNTDPELEDLGNYGAGIPARPPGGASPAINAGTNSGCPSTDVRGVTRPRDGTCDIGAWEVTRYVVNDIGDGADATTNDVCATSGAVCTLRAALQEANAQAARTDHIAFSIAGSGPHTIGPTSTLPGVTDTIIIDGSTEPDYTSAPVVELDGVSAGPANGLVLQLPHNVVRGLAIGRFGASGILVTSSIGGSVFEGNRIGTDTTGTVDRGNTINGIWFQSSPDNVVGGTETGDGNVISGNTISGVVMTDSSGTLIQGNLIGTNAAGTADIQNGFYGIDVSATVSNVATGTLIGGTSAGARNVISGNGQVGVEIEQLGTQDSVVEGNYIGTNAAGTAAVANGQDGVRIETFAHDNTVGGTTTGARNVISGNTGYGVKVGVSTPDNTIAGNYIGVRPDGTTALANAGGGIADSGITTAIGGTAGTDPDGPCSGACNLISGNSLHGIYLSGTDATVQGNFIGTDAAGTADKGNTLSGIFTGATQGTTTIGGATASARNVIAGNNADGVQLGDVNTDGVSVVGNRIGVGADGTTSLGNSNNGVRIAGGAKTNTIGGTAAGAGNVIANNGWDGVVVLTEGSDANTIEGNAIFASGQQGIDLGGDGVTPNDAVPDLDTGPNQLQNFPAVTAAGTGAGTLVDGSLDSAASTAYRLEFFTNGTCDGTNGEGQTFLGATNVTTGAGGTVSFSTSVSGTAAPGELVTATATDPDGNTSEFSACRPVVTGVQMTQPSDDFQTQTDFMVSWSPLDPQGGETFDVRARDAPFNGDFGTPDTQNFSTTSGTRLGAAGHTYCFAARAVEPDNDVSPFGAEACTNVPLNDRAFTRDGFVKKSGTGYYLGTYSKATEKGATLKKTGVQARHLALLATKCSSCGKVRVKFAGNSFTVNLHASNTQKLQVIDLGDLGSVLTGTVIIKTLSDKVVKVEGFGASRVP